MLNKTILAVAFAASVALVLPISASGTWKHHESPIQENLGGSVQGTARFQSALGGIECQATGQAQFTAGQTTGHIQQYGPVTSEAMNCKGLGGLAFCQIHNWTPTGLPWPLHTGFGSQITIDTSTTHAQYTGGFCPIQKSSTTPGMVTLTPNQPNTITTGQLSGSLVQHFQTLNGTTHVAQVQVSGSGQIEAPDIHTYSI